MTAPPGGTPYDALPLRRVRRDVAVSPLIVIWKATRSCPPAFMRCRHPLELSTGEAYRLIDQAAAFGSPGITFLMPSPARQGVPHEAAA